MCVGVDRVCDRVSLCLCGQILESCKCVCIWTEFGIVRVCVRVHRVSDRLSICTFSHSVLICVSVYRC